MVAEEYFQRTADEVFRGVLTQLGGRKVVSSSHLVRYESADWFVELVVLPEDGPRYVPRVGIGPLPELGPLTRHKQVDVMYTAPDGSPLRTYYLHWRYTNSEELLSAFSKVRDEIFMPYAVKVLTNAFALRSLVKLRSAEIEKVWHEEIAEHNEGVYRTKARTALNSKDYVAYLELMEKIPIERRTKSEVARIKYFEKNFDI